MFDTRLRPVIDPYLQKAAHRLALRGIKADYITLLGAVTVPFLILALAYGWFLAALLLLALNRLADGVDGPLARMSGQSGTDWGGFLDTMADFFFYGAVPLGFALYDPYHNGAGAAFLLFSFLLNGAAFHAYAALALKRGISAETKSFPYLAGLAEGGETIAFFVLMMLFVPFFDVLAGAFAILCCVSAAMRVWAVKKVLAEG